MIPRFPVERSEQFSKTQDLFGSLKQCEAAGTQHPAPDCAFATTMRQGPYEIEVVDENGSVLPEKDVNGQSVLEAEHGLTYRVRLRVHPSEDGKFSADKIVARLYVDGYCAESQRTELNIVSCPISKFNLSPTPFPRGVSVTFTGFRKNQHEKVAYVFCLPEASAQYAARKTSNAEEGGTLKIIVYRAVDTGRVQDNSANWPSTVPSALAQTPEDTKLWKRPSIVTSPGKCLVSRTDGAYPVWEKHEQLAALTLPYHSAETIAFLQDFHNAQRDRESLAKALQESLPNPGPDQPVDLTEGDTAVEVKKEYLRAQQGVAAPPRATHPPPVLEGATTPLLVDLTGEDNNDSQGGAKRQRTDV
jgi:hypothetical protein